MLLRKNTAEVEAKGTEQNLPHVLFAGKDTCHYDKIRIVSGDKSLEISPVTEAHSYLWASLSPDGSKILFYAGGVGAFVCDLQGNIIGSYGRCSSPAWCGNNHIVVCRETSDGHQYESASLEIVSRQLQPTSDRPRINVVLAKRFRRRLSTGLQHNRRQIVPYAVKHQIIVAL